MNITKLVLLLIICTGVLFGEIVKSINYEGLIHISKPVADRIVDFESGDELNMKEVDDAIKAFYKQNYFKDIWVTNVDGNVTFHFVEKPIISKIEVEGYDFDEEELKSEILQIDRGFIYDKKKVEAAKKRIIKHLQSEGKIDSVVEVEVKHLENGSVSVTFLVNEGEEIIIESLKFSGVQNMSTGDFDSVLVNKEHEFMGWMWGRNDGKMVLDQIQYDPLRLKNYYWQYGYLDVMIDQPFVRVDFDDYTAKMSYQIDQGEVYRTASIKIVQTKEVLKESFLYDKISLKLNEPFNMKTFQEDAEKLKVLFGDRGYAFVQVVPDLQPDKASKTVDVVYKIMPGEKVYIRNVIVSGNTSTLDSVIRREIYLAPGDLFRLTNLIDSRNALQKTGFFEDSTIEQRRIDERTIDLVAKVVEAPTGSIQIGGGYGSYGGLLVQLSVNDKNMFGSGISMGVDLQQNQKSSNYSFNIYNPRLNDSDYSGTFSFYINSYQMPSYTIDSQGVSLGTGHQFTKYISAGLIYGFSFNQYPNFNGTASPGYNQFLQQYLYQSYTDSSITLNASYDSTDDFYLPRQGMIITPSVRYSGLGGKADYTATSLGFNKYYGFRDWLDFDLIFRYEASYNNVIDNGFLPTSARYYMGGLGTVRGYQAYSISPTYVSYDGNITQVGGTQMFTNSFELDWPFITSAKLRLVTYLDWGMIGDCKSIDEIKKAGYGLGLEWFSPMGPIQIFFSWPYKPQPTDQTSNFEFTMGQRF